MQPKDPKRYRSLDGVVRVSPPPAVPPQPAPSKPVPPQPRAIPVIEEAEIDAITPDLPPAPAPKKGFKLRLPKFTRKRLLIGSGVLLLLISLIVGRIWLTANKIIDSSGESALALQENVDPTQLKGEGDGRVNILLIGIGGEGHKGGDLSDSIMLVSLDPIAKEVAMVSIPRDLYLEIPGYGSSKVNAAHAYGEQYDYKGGGPALLKETLSRALGVPIHYYARLDFEGFKKAIDVVGGVDVTVKKAIYDASYPDDDLRGYAPFQISAGKHHLDGATALKYARSRYSTSDFDRSKRQQDILLAFKTKALSLGTLANPLKLNSLLSTAGDNVRTDLKIEEMLKLLDIAKEVDNSKVKQASLDNGPNGHLASTQLYGAYVLVPKTGNFNQIKAYIRSLLVDGYIRQENASITVLNGTDKAGLATDAAELLRSYGYNIAQVDNAPDQNMTQSTLIDYSDGSKPYTISYLEKRFGVTAVRQQRPEGVTADIVLSLGTNYQAPQQ